MEDTTTTGRRARNPVSYAYSDSEDEESVDESPVSAAKNADDFPDYSNTNGVLKPTIHNWQHWRNKGTDPEQSGFKSVDGGKLFETCRWRGGRYLDGFAEDAIENGERSLLSKQDDQHSITLDFEHNRGRRSLLYGRHITQIPYRK